MNSLNDRSKVVTVKASIPASMTTVDFELEFDAWLKNRGYSYEGLVEVMYEEEER